MCRPKDVCEKFILSGDAAIIETWAHSKSVSISFRPAGSATLKCLARGAGAKPHSILDKSIKRKESGNEAVDAFFNDFSKGNRKVAKNLLLGLVGHWSKVKEGDEEKDTVDGIYLTTLGKNSFPEGSISTKGDMSYLVLDNQKKKDKLITFFKSLFESQEKAEEECRKIAAQTEKAEQEEAQNDEGAGKAPIQYYLFTRLFFSGDYDTHDLMRDRSLIGTVTDEALLKELKDSLSKGRKEQLNNRFCQDKKKGLQAELQEALDDNQKRQLISQFGAGIVNCLGKENDTDYCRVQHGPQSNYTAQMANENLAIILKAIEDKKHDLDGLNTLANSVMKMDLPVAMCDGLAKGNANWSILDGPKALHDFYDNLGLKIKSTWRDEDDGRDERIIHLFGSVIHYIFGATELRRNFDTDEKKRKKVEKILSGYQIMYDNENYKEKNGKTKYVNCLEKALDKAFR